MLSLSYALYLGVYFFAIKSSYNNNFAFYLNSQAAYMVGQNLVYSLMLNLFAFPYLTLV